MNAKKAVVMVLALVGFIWMSGCTKLTYDRWKTLTPQSSKGEVEAVLGDEHVAFKKAEAWMYHDPDRQVSVNLEFVGGDKVTYSRWVDPQYGMHEFGTAAIEGTNLKERDTRKTTITP